MATESIAPLSIEQIYHHENGGSRHAAGDELAEAQKANEAKAENPIPKGRSFIDVLAYNNEPQDAVESLKEIYSQLKDQSIFLAGFQFVGISLTDNESLEEGEDVSVTEIIFFMLTLGFFLSLLAAMMAFTSCEYLTGLQGEDPKFIRAGIINYRNHMRIAEMLLFADSGLFLTANMLSAYLILPTRTFVPLAIISLGLMLVGLWNFYAMVIRRQIYQLEDGTTICRNMYRHIQESQHLKNLKEKGLHLKEKGLKQLQETHLHLPGISAREK